MQKCLQDKATKNERMKGWMNGLRGLLLLLKAVDPDSPNVLCQRLQVAKDVFIYGHNTRFWLLQIMEDLKNLIILHQLNQSLQPLRKYLSIHFKDNLIRALVFFYIFNALCRSKLIKFRILSNSEVVVRGKNSEFVKNSHVWAAQCSNQSLTPP